MQFYPYLVLLILYYLDCTLVRPQDIICYQNLEVL
jgi:hypothetical protein